jgi:PAS domain S-box-containing protein
MERERLTPVVLLVEDEPAHAELCRRGLESAAVSLEIVGDLEAARAWLASRAADLVISDLRLPDGIALDLLDGDRLALVVMTSQGDEQRAVEAMKRGALDYVVKSPAMFRELPALVERALRAARNIAERTSAEGQLRESEARFRQLAGSVQDVFWLYEIASDRIIYVSPAWQAWFGTSPDDVLGPMARRLEVVDGDDRARVAAALRERAPTAPLRYELRAHGAGGARVIEERTFPIADTAGRPWRIAGLMTDLTQRRVMESALHKASQLDSLGQLVGGVTHEYSNMLGTILFATEQLADELRGDPAKRELCDLAIHAASRCNELTRQLMAFARRGAVAVRPLDLNQLVWDAITLLRRSVDPRVMILGDLRASPATVRGDATQLQTAVVELALRAGAAMPEGGELSLETDGIVLDELACASMGFAIEPGPYVRVSVRDSGVAMSQAQRDHLFDPFTAGAADAAAPSGSVTRGGADGASIGLAAVYGTVVAHHGAVTVYAGAERGTVVHLYVPRHADGVVVARAEAPAPRGSGLVLVIDDEPLFVDAISRVLSGLGYSVATARDEAGALAQIREHHARMAAVICDYMMPRTLGTDLVRSLRAIAPDVPVLLSSGYVREQRLAELGPLAIAAFLPKPIRKAELAAVLASAARRV